LKKEAGKKEAGKRSGRKEAAGGRKRKVKEEIKSAFIR
jgi:hypothetical protein